MKLLRFLRGRREQTNAIAPEDLEPKPKDWSIVTLRNESSGEVAVMRVRFERPSRGDISNLRAAIVVKWPYSDLSQMPAQVENERQLLFERALDPLAPSEISELVHVSTGMGLKEWIFYATSSEAFMERFNQLLSGFPAFPIEIEFYDDPEWQVWADMVGPLRARVDA